MKKLIKKLEQDTIKNLLPKIEDFFDAHKALEVYRDLD
jgi:hypothetical protein